MNYSFNLVEEMNPSNLKVPWSSACHNKEGTIKDFTNDALTQGCIMMCNFNNSIRSKENAYGCSIVGFDFDGGATIIDARNKFSGISHISLFSKNHLKDKQDGKGIVERFHIFAFLDNVIDSSEIYSHIWTSMNNKIGATADGQACDISRLWAQHMSLAWYEKGATIDTKKITDEYIIKTKFDSLRMKLCEEKEKKLRRFLTVDPLAVAMKLASRYKPAISGQNGHNQTIGVARMARKCGLCESEIYQVLVEYNKKCRPMWSDKELKHKANSAYFIETDRLSPGYMKKVLENV